MIWLFIFFIVVGFLVVPEIIHWWQSIKILRDRQREALEFQDRMMRKRRNRNANCHNSPEERYMP